MTGTFMPRLMAYHVYDDNLKTTLELIMSEGISSEVLIAVVQ